MSFISDTNKFFEKNKRLIIKWIIKEALPPGESMAIG
jgi:hypothetical protein